MKRTIVGIILGLVWAMVLIGLIGSTGFLNKPDKVCWLNSGGQYHWGSTHEPRDSQTIVNDSFCSKETKSPTATDKPKDTPVPKLITPTGDPKPTNDPKPTDVKPTDDVNPTDKPKSTPTATSKPKDTKSTSTVTATLSILNMQGVCVIDECGARQTEVAYYATSAAAQTSMANSQKSISELLLSWFAWLKR